MPDIKLVRRGGDTVFYVISGHDDGCAAAGHVSCGGTIVSGSVDDWNRELSPWPAQKCFKGGEDFGGRAGEYLAGLLKKIPGFEAENGITPVKRVLCGYSLAGLCALYALYVTDMFNGAVSASGSMWFDGWIDFMQDRNIPGSARCVYLSVGDREARTRNPRLASVEECTRRACAILQEKGAAAEFELNPGNHFNEPDVRLARGMDRLYEMICNDRYGG